MCRDDEILIAEHVAEVKRETASDRRAKAVGVFGSQPHLIELPEPILLVWKIPFADGGRWRKSRLVTAAVTVD